MLQNIQLKSPKKNIEKECDDKKQCGFGKVCVNNKCELNDIIKQTEQRFKQKQLKEDNDWSS
jgi:hypothetical protein